MLSALPPPPPQLLVGAQVWVDDGHAAGAKEGWGVVLKGGKVAAVGEAAKLAKAWPNAQKVELKGGTLLPGFIEGHAHVESLGALSRRVELSGCRTLEEALERVKTWAAAHPEGWILGRGWDQNRWSDKRFPTAADLDRVLPGRPIALTRVDGHALWVNSAALAAAGITQDSKDPEGGQILRDPSGHPSGVLLDLAEAMVTKVLPPVDLRERETRLLAGLRTLLAQGFSAVADMGVDGDAVDLYRRLAKEGRLPIRVFAYLNDDLRLMQRELRGRGPGPLSFFQVQGVKFYLDGALGSRGARLQRPYADAPGQLGLWLTDPRKLLSRATVTLRAGYQPAVHAIGDAANQAALQVLAQAKSKRGKGPMPRIEHAQILTAQDAAAFGSAGIVASIQPVHCTSDHAWTPARLGPERVGEAFPWRRLVDGGALLAFGSDAPVEDPNPFFGLASAETRQDPEGQPPGGFLPDQRLTRLESIRGFTWGNGQALGRKDLGVIKPGAAADLLWLDAPMATLPAGELRSLHPGRLWIAGREAQLQTHYGIAFNK